MVIPDEALALIDSVAANRTSFMVGSAVAAAEVKLRMLEDEEIANWCSQHAAVDATLESEFASTLSDGLKYFWISVAVKYGAFHSIL